ncbi:hypothetical protein [Alicyclobacillus contaminans]|uniref:hypothetical protein n=1 Tax=Alicyclobacillus contaminans TaxID=392016 RepID=UPI0003F4CCBF|nr:hypothetical protein [Alicyclobacillus contaminans]
MDDVRGRAAAILSGHKLRMLEEAGLTVVEQSELDRLRMVEQAAYKVWSGFAMGNPGYESLYDNPPEEMRQIHDLTHGRECNWVLVERSRLEGLERMYKATKRRAEALHGHLAFNAAEEAFYAAEDDIEAVLTELEAMER